MMQVLGCSPGCVARATATGSRAASLRRPAHTAFAGLRRLPAVKQLVRAAAAAEVEIPEVELDNRSSSAIRKYLTTLGWDRSWVDVVTDRVVKNKEAGVTTDTIKGMYDLLLSLGIPSQSICNMASLSHEILGVDTSKAQSLIDYIKRCGVDGEALVGLLMAHPKLLTFDVEGNSLVKGKARAAVTVVPMRDTKKAVVSYFREGAAFTGSPVAPVSPK